MGRPPIQRQHGLPVAPAAPAADTVSKKDRLTLLQLASYDDLLTDVLVDHVYSWFTVRKNKSKYAHLRRINDDEVCHILLHDLVIQKDISEVEAKLLKLPGLERYHNALESKREQEDFKRHMRKYINVWMPDCPFDISTTNRYTITTHEAATTARQFIKSGETIKYLCGNLVAMSPEEVKDLDLNRQDFSVVISSRRKTPSLFLGPARFSNHDCKANARLVTKGVEGMTVVAERNIERDEEITVNYGMHYFGEDNCECLCASCEKEVRGGWAPKEENEESDTEPDTTVQHARPSQSSDGHKRDHNKQDSSDQIDARGSNPPKKARLGEEHALAPTGLKTPPDSSQKSSPASEKSPYHKPSRRGLGQKEQLSVQAGSAQLSSNNGGKRANTKTIDASCFYGTKQPHQPVSLSQRDEFIHKAVKQEKSQSFLDWFGDIGAKQKQSPHASLWNAPMEPTNRQSKLSNAAFFPGERFNLHKLVDRGCSSTRRGVSARFAPTPSPSSSALSSVPPDLDEDDAYQAPQARSRGKKGRPKKPLDQLALSTKQKYQRKPYKYVSSAQPISIETVEEDDDESDEEPEVRVPRAPGDYVRTRALLSQRNSRWVDCRTCENTWVNHHVKQTRRECPRCERHSKLFGFQWPKTENAKGEHGVRVMDHRTIDRFLAPDEEKKECRRGRGLLAKALGLDGNDSSRSSRAVSEEADEGSRTRALRRTTIRAGQKRPSDEEEVLSSTQRSGEKTPKRPKGLAKGWAMVPA
ncbi:uncharacterized protein KY384_003164 [Bacidia gigantensis]|uniref:uncharacterized protein n=1 Tax=Bacidia gigantensis TaxID=2732470 RepID=UPI001D049027|nr:uncharacterized protein KY384_003164 [Bacidia gigantensis]KAG8531535.1 hypothetical protein KY384_003164 [Bacidia gigantensis]